MKCDIGGWNVYNCKCKSCFYPWIGAVPTNADPTKLECARCGSTNSNAIQAQTKQKE